MSFNINNQEVKEIYVGNKQVLEAYVGSSLVYSLPSGYDSYKVHLTWSSNDNFNMAGLKINGVQATTSQVTSLWFYNGNWEEASTSDRETAIQWDNNDNGKSFYGTAIDINFTADDVPSTVQVHTGKWYGGGSMTVTVHVAGVKDDVETDLGYTSDTNDADLIYTVSIS